MTLRTKLLLLMTVFIGQLSNPAASEPGDWQCQVANSDDLFQIYQEQLIFRGETFSVYQLIDGLTILAVNHETGRFNRLSNLNLLPHSSMDPARPPEPHQFFTGSCQPLN